MQVSLFQYQFRIGSERYNKIKQFSLKMSPYIGFFPFIISLLLYIILGPVFVIVLLVNEIIRLIVSVYLKLKYNGDIFLISNGNDAMFSAKIPGKSRMVLMGFRYKGRMTKEQACDIYYGKIQKEMDSDGDLSYKRLEYLITQKFGYGAWKINKNFDLKNHIRYAQGEKAFTKADMQKLLKELSEDMDPSRPQWELVIVPRYKADDEDYETEWTITRFNHTYLDGLSLIMFGEKYYFSNFTYYLNPMTFKIESWKMFLFYLNSVIFAPYSILMTSILSLKQLWPLVEIPKGRTLKRNFQWTTNLKMEDVNIIRKAINNTTLSAVVENAFISAILQTLPSKRVPEEWVVGELAALLPYKAVEPQNRFTGFMYKINSSEDDFTRLGNSKQAAWDGMIGPFIPVLYFCFKTVGRMPEFCRSLLFAQLPSTFFFSNVPTSKTKVKTITNAEVVEFVGFPPQPNNTGIALGCATYQGSVKVGCSAQCDWLRKDELDDIMKKIPKIIKEWAMKAGELNFNEKSSLSK